MVRMQEDEDIGEKETVAKILDKFKQPSQWRVFAKMNETYLSQLKGSGWVPLNYVISKLAELVQGAIYETDAEQNTLEMRLVQTPIPYLANEFLIDEDDIDENDLVDPKADMPEADGFDAEMCNQYISVEVLVPRDGILIPAKVIGPKHVCDGNPIEVGNSKPLLDSRVYEVQSPDGHTEEFAANTIADNICSQVDTEGNQYLLLSEIINHRKNSSA